MAITAATLQHLTAHGYGPLRFSQSANGFGATFEGQTAGVHLDGQTVCVYLREAITWPAVSPLTPEETEQRITIALTSVALLRPELLTVRAERATESVQISLWLDAEQSSAHDLAAAVRTVNYVGALARDALDQISLNLAAERELVDAARDAAVAAQQTGSAVRYARNVLEPVSDAQPLQAAAATVAPPAGGVCASCGMALMPGSRFCVRCGTPAP